MEMPIVPIKIGDKIQVTHEWGHRMEATYLGKDKFWAELRFGIAGVRRVRVGPETRKFSPGKFRSSKMKLWFVDTGTLERILASEEGK